MPAFYPNPANYLRQGSDRLWRLRKGAASWPAFDPLSIPWEHSFWAEGPEFAALGLADAASATTWPSESSAVALDQPTGAYKPTYRASDASFNNKPILQTDGTNDYMTTASISTIAQPITHVLVMLTTDTTDGAIIDSTTTTRNLFQRIASGSVWRIYTTAPLDSPSSTADSIAHIFFLTYNGANSSIQEDGSVLVTGTAGTQSLGGQIALAATISGAAPVPAKYAFWGILAGTLTVGQKSDLLAWAQSHYGTP